MDYHVNEGSFAVPDTAQDRSVNMLILNHGPGGLTLAVTRDVLPQGEALEAFVLRQLRTLASQAKQFKQGEPTAVTVGAAKLPAVQVGTSFRQNNAGIHQLQTALLLDDSKVLVLTLTCSAPLTPEQAAYAQQLLDSFTPH